LGQRLKNEEGVLLVRTRMPLVVLLKAFGYAPGLGNRKRGERPLEAVEQSKPLWFQPSPDNAVSAGIADSTENGRNAPRNRRCP
jgi:hypothetical protein